MEDIISQQLYHEQGLSNQTFCPLRDSNIITTHQRLPQSNSLNKLIEKQDQLLMSQSARKMLETVLRNANINAVPHNIPLPPQTVKEYTQLTLHILQNKILQEENIAHVIRSQVDLLKYDTTLELLVINEFGFQMHSRIFHSQNQHENTSDDKNASNQNHQQQPNINAPIGIVTMGKFMLEFGKIHDIFQDMDSTYKKILDIVKVTNIKFIPKEPLKQSNSQGDKQSLISPVCSQQQLDEAKQYEAAQITKVFEDSQLQYLKSKSELLDSNKQQLQWDHKPISIDSNVNYQGNLDKFNGSDDDLIAADEDMTSISHQISKSILNSHSYGYNKHLHQKQKRYPEYSGLQTLLNQQKKQLLSQKLQQQQQIQKTSQIQMVNKSAQQNVQGVNDQYKNEKPQNYIDYKQQQQEDANKLIQDLSYSLNNNINNNINNNPFKSLLSLNNNEKSLISANNSYFNTPIKPPNNVLYPNHSQFKPRNSNKTLFEQQQHNSHSTMPSQFYQESPKFLPSTLNKDMTIAPRVLSFSANKVLSSLQSPSPIKTQIQYIGQKRQNPITTAQLATKIQQEQQQQQLNQVNLQNLEGYSTPSAKRQKISNDPLSTLTKGSHYPKNEDTFDNQNYTDSEEDKDDANGDINDAASSASRKKRGLKILSVKVQELVFDKEHTTYKDVANELIKQLRDKKKNKHVCNGGDTGAVDMDANADDFDDNNSGADDDDMSDDISPTKKTDKGDNSSSQQKWEKNVRRRVYDALNVLYAAGVLKKEGKHVSCDKKVLHLTNRFKDNNSHNNQHSAQKSNQTAKSQEVSVQDQKMLQHIENLKHQLSLQMQKIEMKRENLHEQFKHFLSYKHLIERNKDLKSKGYYDPNKSIQLPFILVSTKDCPDNEVEISFGDQNKSLNIAMKKPIKCIGDADTLIKLGLFKVNENFIYDHIQEGETVLKCLNLRQREEILA